MYTITTSTNIKKNAQPELTMRTMVINIEISILILIFTKFNLSILYQVYNLSIFVRRKF